MKKVYITAILLLTSILSFNVSALNNKGNAENPTDFTVYGRDGFEHKPNLITFEQASSFCGEVVANKKNEDETLYFRCVNSFAPFTTNSATGSSCSIGTVVRWGGGCTATLEEDLESNKYVDLSHQRNNDMFSGNAKYRCMNGSLQLINQTCVELPENCYIEDHKNIQWPVTYPNWAKSGGALPKAACEGDLQVNMRSLTITQIKPVSTEYHYSDSGYDLLCIDGILTRNAIDSRKQDCNYIPKSCNAKTYSYQNCDFNVPNTVHEYNLSNPDAPGKEVSVAYDGDTYHGDVNMECFDGLWSSASSQTCYQNPICGNIIQQNKNVTLNNSSKSGLIQDCNNLNGVLSDISGNYTGNCNYKEVQSSSLCSVGTYNSLNLNNGTWNCFNGRKTKSCSSTPIGSANVASCGSVNGTSTGSLSSSSPNLCSSGEVSGFYEESDSWTWNCVNTTVTSINSSSCSANKILDTGCFYEEGKTYYSYYSANHSAGGDAFVDIEETKIYWGGEEIYYYYSSDNSESDILDVTERGSDISGGYIYTSGNRIGFTDDYEVCREVYNEPSPVCGASNGGTFSTAPNTGLCQSGTASSVSDGLNYSWTCSNSTETVNCSANKEVVSACKYDADNYIIFKEDDHTGGDYGSGENAYYNLLIEWKYNGSVVYRKVDTWDSNDSGSDYFSESGSKLGYSHGELIYETPTTCNATDPCYQEQINAICKD